MLSSATSSSTRTATRCAAAGDEITLTATEFELLRFLMRNPRRVLSKAQILDRVWNYDFGGQANVVELYISYLRKKIDAGREPMIHTMRGAGYVLKPARRDARRLRLSRSLTSRLVVTAVALVAVVVACCSAPRRRSPCAATSPTSSTATVQAALGTVRPAHGGDDDGGRGAPTGHRASGRDRGSALLTASARHADSTGGGAHRRTGAGRDALLDRTTLRRPARRAGRRPRATRSTLPGSATTGSRSRTGAPAATRHRRRACRPPTSTTRSPA